MAPGQRWEISQIYIKTNGLSITPAQLVYNNQIIATSANGNNDLAAQDPAILLRAGDSLAVKWTATTAGDICTAVFFYTIVDSPQKKKPAAPVQQGFQILGPTRGGKSGFTQALANDLAALKDRFR